jgi:hypothetical protein
MKSQNFWEILHSITVFRLVLTLFIVKPGSVNATFLLTSAYFKVCRSDLDFEPGSALRNVLTC